MRSTFRRRRLVRLASSAWVAVVALLTAFMALHCKSTPTTGDTQCPTSSPSAGNACDVDASTICRYGCDEPFTCVDGQWMPYVINGFQPDVPCPDAIPEAGSACDVCRTNLECSYACPQQSNTRAVCVAGSWEADPCKPFLAGTDAGAEDAAGD